jgi:hypothetical protein
MLKRASVCGTIHCMKVLSTQEASQRLDAVCKEALAGEVIRLRPTNGSLLELTPVPIVTPTAAPSPQELADCYSDPEWAEFENGCSQASA